MTRRLLVLIGLTLAFWVIVALPARWLSGDRAILYSGTAGLLCLVPAILTLVWAGLASSQPQQQMTIVMTSSGIRLFFVLGLAFVLLTAVEPFRASTAFGIWVLVFYLFTLAVETVLMLAGGPTQRGP